MFTKAAQPYPFLVVVVLLVLMEWASPTSGTPPSVQARKQEELLLSITINQMALLKEMNASSSACTSRESELRELRLLKEAVMEQLERMKAETSTELEVMKNEAKEQLQGMEEETKGRLQAMEEETKGRLQAMEEESISELRAQVQEVEEEANVELQRVEGVLTRNQEMVGRLDAMEMDLKFLVGIELDAQPLLQKPDLENINANHNDTNPSLCGENKVLYGSRGSLSPSHPSGYQSNMDCTWQVILPAGTRPVFTWEYLHVEHCGNPLCPCDWVQVAVPGLEESTICGYGDRSPSHPLYYNITGRKTYGITSNKFTVKFHSDHGGNRKGFVLHYEATRHP